MSGLFGSLPIKKVELAGDKVTFKGALEFGERKLDISFKGTVKESKLTGELTTPMGTTKVTGTKVIRRWRGRRRGTI